MPKHNVIDLFQQIAGNQFGYFSRIGKVRDVLSNEAIPTVSCDDTFGQFVNRLTALRPNQNFCNSASSMAIVDPCDNELIGMFQRSTALRFYPKYINTLSEKDHDREILKAGIASLATRPIPTVSADSDLLETLTLFIDQPVDFILVVDEESEPFGYVTPWDFVRVMSIYHQVYQQDKPLQRLRLADMTHLSLDDLFYRGAQTVRDVMRPPVCIGKDDRIADAINRFNEEEVQHMVVVDENGGNLQVISCDDVLLAMHPPQSYQFFDFTNPFPRLDELISGEIDHVLVEPVSTLAREPKYVDPTSRFCTVLDLMLSQNESAFLVKEGEDLQGVVTTTEVLSIFKTLLQIGEWNDDQR